MAPAKDAAALEQMRSIHSVAGANRDEVVFQSRERRHFLSGSRCDVSVKPVPKTMCREYQCRCQCSVHVNGNGISMSIFMPI